LLILLCSCHIIIWIFKISKKCADTYPYTHIYVMASVFVYHMHHYGKIFAKLYWGSVKLLLKYFFSSQNLKSALKYLFHHTEIPVEISYIPPSAFFLSSLHLKLYKKIYDLMTSFGPWALYDIIWSKRTLWCHSEYENFILGNESHNY